VEIEKKEKQINFEAVGTHLKSCDWFQIICAHHSNLTFDSSSHTPCLASCVINTQSLI